MWLQILVALPPLLVFLIPILHSLRVGYRKPLHIRSHRHKPYGYVYFYRGRREWLPVVKIGKAKRGRLIERLKEQRTANPFGLYVYGVVRVRNHHQAEAWIHGKFKNLRISVDNEWFWLYPRLWIYILLVKNGKLTNRVQETLDGKLTRPEHPS